MRPRLSPWNFILFICLILIFAGTSFAQTATPTSTLPVTPTPTPTNIFAAGVSGNPSASPFIAGTAMYAHTVDNSGTYAFSIIDILPGSASPFQVSTSIGGGIAQKIFTIAGVPVYIPTAAGIAFTGANTGWAWSTGGLAAIKISRKSNLSLMPSLRLMKSNVGATSYSMIPGLMIAWGK